MIDAVSFRTRARTIDHLGREQIAEASNSLDICTAFVGRDERADLRLKARES